MRTFIKFLSAFVTMLLLVILFSEGVEIDAKEGFWNGVLGGLMMAPTMVIVFYWVLNKLTPNNVSKE